MKILVTGGRNFTDRPFVYTVLDSLWVDYPDMTLIHGAAPGADTLADDWARIAGVPRLPFPADWDRYKHRAGSVRNRKMLVEGKPQLVVAFRGGMGTADMIRVAEEAGIPVVRTWRTNE